MKNITCLLILMLLTAVHADAQQPADFIVTDYSVMDHWAAHPWKWDYADSIPKSIRANYNPDTTKADIFFIHPTSYTDVKMPFGWNAPVDDSVLNKATDEGTILYQASIFNEAGRVFAPRYQQANINAYYSLNRQAAERALDNAYADVKAAFEYYLAHYNNGRPIVIASHSQGSTHSQRLIKEFFDGKPLQNQLVAAYIVGMDLNPNQYTSLTECTKPSQTGCICGWRSYESGFVPLYIKLEQFNSIVTNPLTWDAAKPKASRNANKGTTLGLFDVIVPKLADAEAKARVLWVNPGSFSDEIGTNNYHVMDMNLFYVNIRENVKLRVNSFAPAVSAIPAKKNDLLLTPAEAVQ